MDALSLSSIAMFHIGSRHLQLNFTEYQKKMLKHPVVQATILFAIIFASTKNLLITLIVLCIIYILLNIMLNEHSEWSIIVDPDSDVGNSDVERYMERVKG